MAKGPKATNGAKKDAASLILAPYLYLGPKTAASSPAFLASAGITHVLSIGATPAGAPVPGVTYRRLALADDTDAGIEDVVRQAGAVIAEVASASANANANPKTTTAAKAKGSLGKGGGSKILVHCSAAVSRSPTVVAAYLMRWCGMTLREALGTIVRARPAVCPNAGFLRQLRGMDVEIHGKASMGDVEALPGRKEERLALFSVLPGPGDGTQEK